MAVSERDPFDRLNDDLDALAEASAGRRVNTSPTPVSADANLAFAFVRLRRLDVPTAADARLSQRIWEELMNEATLPDAVPLPMADASSGDVNGRAAPRPWRARMPTLPSRRGPFPSLFAPVATTLLVVVTVLAAFVVIRPHQVTLAPLLGALPQTQAPSSNAGAPELLLRTTIAADRDAGPLDLSFWRGAIAPGGEVTSPPDWADHPGTEVEVVLRGTLVVQADAPLRVVRQGRSSGEPEPVSAGAEVVLAEGDAAILPSESTHRYRNPGEETVELLGVLVLTDQSVVETLSVADGYLIRNGNLVGGIPAEQAPQGPMTLTLAQVAGAENAWPAQAIREDGVVEWRVLEFSPLGTPEPDRPGGTVYVLTLGLA